MTNRSLAWLKVFGVAFALFTAIYVVGYYVLTDIGPARSLEGKYRDELTGWGFFETEQQFLDSFKVPPEEDSSSEVIPILEKMSQPPFISPNDSEYIAYLQKNRKQIEQLEQIRPKLYCAFNNGVSSEFDLRTGLSDNTMYIAIVLSRVGSIQYQKSDRLTAYRYWKLAARLASYVRDGGGISDLQQMAFASWSLTAQIESCINYKTLSRADASTILNLLTPLDSPLPIMKAIQREHWKTLAQASDWFKGTVRHYEVGPSLDQRMRGIPGIKSASAARIHEAYLAFAKSYDPTNFATAAPSLLKLQQIAQKETLSYKMLASFCLDIVSFTSQIFDAYDLRQRLFAKLERIAGIKKQRFDSKGNEV